MAHVLTVSNAKGGAGKTTVAVNLAATLARRGGAAIVDLDPFGSASGSLGRLPEGGDSTRWIRGEVVLGEARATSTAGLAILPSTPDLATLDDRLRRDPGLVRRRLGAEAGAWRWVVLDSGPASGPIPTAALVAGDLVLVPVPLTALDIERLPGTLGVIREARGGLDGVLLVPNRWNRTRLAAEVLDVLRQRFAGAVSRVVIPETVRIAEAPGFGCSVLESDPEGGAAHAFEALGKEIERRIKA